MKNTLLKLYTAAFFLCSTFTLFAATSPGDGSDGTLEDTDALAATPIDDSLWVLVIIGLIYVFLKFRAVPFQTRKDEETQS